MQDHESLEIYNDSVSEPLRKAIYVKVKNLIPDTQKQSPSVLGGTAKTHHTQTNEPSSDATLHHHHGNNQRKLGGGYNLCVCLGKIDIVVDKQRVDQSRVRLAEVEVGDETGVISLRARDDQITLLRNILDKRSGNDKSKLPAIVIRNCSVELYLGSYLRIAVSKWGKISEYPDDVASTPPPPTYINRSVDYSSMDFSLSTAIICDRKSDQIKAQVNTSAQHLSSEQYGTGTSFSTDRDHTLGSVRQRGVDRRKRHTKQNNRQQNLHRGSAVMEGMHGSQYIPYHHQHPYTVGRSHFPYGHGGIIEGSNPSSLGWQMGYPDHLHHYSSMYSPPNGRADYSPYTFSSTHLRGRQDGMYQAHHYGHSMDLYQQQPPETIHHEGGDANEGAEIPKSEEKDRESTLLPAVTDSSESPKEMPPTEHVGNHVSAQQHQEEVSHQYPGEIEHFPTTIHSPTQQNPLSRYFRNLRIGDPQRSSSPFSVSSTSHASAAQMDPSAATFYPRTGGWEAPRPIASQLPRHFHPATYPNYGHYNEYPYTDYPYASPPQMPYGRYPPQMSPSFAPPLPYPLNSGAVKRAIPRQRETPDAFENSSKVRKENFSETNKTEAKKMPIESEEADTKEHQSD